MNLKTLDPFIGVLSNEMLKRMASAGIYYNLVIDEYQKGEQNVIDLLEHRVDGKAQVIKSQKILHEIIDYLNSIYTII